MFVKQSVSVDSFKNNLQLFKDARMLMMPTVVIFGTCHKRYPWKIKRITMCNLYQVPSNGFSELVGYNQIRRIFSSNSQDISQDIFFLRSNDRPIRRKKVLKIIKYDCLRKYEALVIREYIAGDRVITGEPSFSTIIVISYVQLIFGRKSFIITVHLFYCQHNSLLDYSNGLKVKQHDNIPNIC